MKQTSFKQSDVYAQQQPEEHVAQKARPVVIEQTAKKYKLGILIGILLCVISGVVVFFGLASEYAAAYVVLGGLIFIAGFAAVCVSKFLAWWHHG